MFLCVEANLVASSIVLSVEQSSIRINSHALYVWFKTLEMVSVMKVSELYNGVIIETSAFKL